MGIVYKRKYFNYSLVDEADMNITISNPNRIVHMNCVGNIISGKHLCRNDNVGQTMRTDPQPATKKYMTSSLI